MSSSQQPTVLFSIYQNNTWTIRCLVNETIDPATQRIILKIVGFVVSFPTSTKNLERSLHQACFDADNIKDVIDAFLLEMENPTEDHKEFYTENQLTVILSDLFLAGSETTGKSLEWGCLFMLLNPEVNMV